MPDDTAADHHAADRSDLRVSARAPFGNSITGGQVYRGFDLAPSFQGRYFFAEFVFRRLFSMPLTLDSGTGEAAARRSSGSNQSHDEVGGQNAVGRIVSIDVDARGELYLVDHTGGRLLKLVMDTDGDNLPDGWEARFGLDRESAVGPQRRGRRRRQRRPHQRAGTAEGTHPSNVAALTRYLAEGSSSSFFDTTIGIANPGAQPASVLLRFLRTDGVVITWPLTIPGLQHATVRPAQITGLARRRFLHGDRNRSRSRGRTHDDLVARQPLRQPQRTRGRHAVHVVVPRRRRDARRVRHVLPDRESERRRTANVQVTYLRPNGRPPIVLPYDVEGHTRKTIWVDAAARARRNRRVRQHRRDERRRHHRRTRDVSHAVTTRRSWRDTTAPA